MKLNTRDLKDINKFMEENKKWYWYVPFIGFFIFQAQMTEFMSDHRIVVASGVEANSNYDYVQVENKLMYRGVGYDAAMKKVMRVHSYTLGLSVLLVLLFEILIFNFAPLWFKSISKKVIKQNK